MFYDNVHDIIRIVIIGLCIYPILILLLRISGKRTLSKMNMFDFVITIALGSTVATILLSKKVSYIDGVTALAVLIFLQYAASFLSMHFGTFNQLIKGKPTLLFYRGSFLREHMKRERIREEEIRQAIRTSGLLSIDKIEAVVLETDGSISVIQKSDDGNNSSLKNISTQ